MAEANPKTMIKSAKVVLIFCLFNFFYLGLFQSCAFSADNFVVNPSFEDDKPQYWSGYCSNSSNQAIYASDYALVGNRSLKLVHNVSGSSYWVGQTINFTKPYPTILNLSGYAKGLNLSADSLVALEAYIVFENGQSTRYFINTRFPKGTYNWTKKAYTQNFNKTIKSVTPYLRFYTGAGTVWFDYISISIPNSSNKVLNPYMMLSEPLKWTSYRSSGSNQCQYVSNPVHSGTRSIRISNNVSGNSHWVGTPFGFAAPYPRSFSFSGWAKGLNISSTALAALDFYIMFEDNTTTYYNQDTRFPTGTFDWTNKQIAKTFDKGIKIIRPYLKLYNGTGTIWFDDIEVSVGSAPALSISIDPKAWDMLSKEVKVGQTVTMSQQDKITVTNDGNAPETFTLALINPAGNPAPWTAAAQPGLNTYVLSGFFCNENDIPLANNFNQDMPTLDEDIILTQTKPATQTIFGYAQATANGVSVPSNNKRYLYLQFKSPTITDKTNEQNISVIISCETP